MKMCLFKLIVALLLKLKEVNIFTEIISFSFAFRIRILEKLA